VGVEKQLEPLSCIRQNTGKEDLFKLDFPVQSFLMYRAVQYNPSKLTNGVHV
jgi:hypothetical protein